MKKRVIELLLLAVSLCVMTAPVVAQAPADQAQTEQAPKPEPDTTPVKIIAVVLLVVVIGVIIMRRRGKKSSEEEF